MGGGCPGTEGAAASSWAALGPPTQLCLTGLPPQSIIRVVFHDRRLQYTEHQQLEGWRWSRPGDRILDIGESPWAGPLCFQCPPALRTPWALTEVTPGSSWP